MEKKASIVQRLSGNNDGAWMEKAAKKSLIRAALAVPDPQFARAYIASFSTFLSKFKAF